MLECAIQQSSLSGTRTALTPDQLAMAATAVSSIGPSNTLVGTVVGLPCGMQEYSPPERFTPHSTTWLLFASMSMLPDTWSPLVGLAALTVVGAPAAQTAPAATRARAGRTSSQERLRLGHLGIHSPLQVRRPGMHDGIALTPFWRSRRSCQDSRRTHDRRPPRGGGRR